MSNIDSPDGQRGAVGAEQLLASLANPAFTVTVPVAPNVKALWIFGEGAPDPLPTVTGVDTGYDYPVTWAPWVGQPETDWFSVVAIVTGAADTEVTITWGFAPAEHWYVVADNGGRFSLDIALAQAIGAPGLAQPTTAVLVAGSDGADLRVLLTDATGKLITSGGAFPAVYGVPGAANPADALQVAGSDGVDLRTLSATVAGWLNVVDQAVSAVITTHGFGSPAEVLQVGGTDGAFLRALLTDTTGKLLTIDQNLKLAVAVLGTALPADAVLAGGSDGVNVRALRTDQHGTPYAIPSAPSLATGDRPPVDLTWVSVTGIGATQAIIAAPGAGKAIRLFYVAGFAFSAAANYFISCTEPGGGTVFPVIAEVPAGSTPNPSTLPLTGLLCKANSAVNIGVNAGSCGATVGYTVETV